MALYDELCAFCPFTEWVHAGFYVLPVRGPARLWGGEEAVLSAVRDLVERTVALTPSVGVAEGYWLTAHATQAVTRVAPPAMTTYRRGLPIEAVLDATHATLAHRLGLHTVGAFADIPAARVLERFSRTVVTQHELARGVRDADLRDHAFLSRVMTARGEIAEPLGQLGFFGDHGALDRRAERVHHRLASRLGPHAVVTAELVGGRTPEARTRWRPWGDATVVTPDEGPWPGGLPQPWPMVTCATPTAVMLWDDQGAELRVTRRGALTASPHHINLVGRGTRPVQWWAGPWLEDESWWSSRPRRAHMQLVLDDDLAVWVYASGTRWWLAGIYD
jgi:hypothetical protein